MKQSHSIGRRIAISFALCTALLFTTMAPSCGPKKIQAAAEAAKDIGGGTRDVIAAVKKAYEQNLLTIEQKDKLADLLIQIAKGGQRGVDAIDTLYKSGITELNGSQAQILNKLFSDEVVAPFLQLLTDVANLSDASSLAIRAAVASLRTIILLLSQRIGRTDVIEQINAVRWINV